MRLLTGMNVAMARAVALHSDKCVLRDWLTPRPADCSWHSQRRQPLRRMELLHLFILLLLTTTMGLWRRRVHGRALRRGCLLERVPAAGRDD